MSAPARKGWCPALLTPMASGDGLLVRVKPTGARLTADDARAIAEAAACCGNGHIDLTNRANLQLRGLRQETVAPFAAVVLARGLACSDPAVEQVRNVMASPLGGDDPSALFDSFAAARAMEDSLARDPALTALPPKFGFLADGSGALPLDGVTADVMLRARDGQVLVCLDGSDSAAVCTLDAMAKTACALARAFLTLRDQMPAPPRRMRALVETAGAASVFAAAGLTPQATFDRMTPQRPRPSPLPGKGAQAPGPNTSPPCKGGDGGGSFHSNWRAKDAGAAPKRLHDTAAIGSNVYLQGICAFGVGLPFGQIEANALTALADLAAHHGDGTLRTTPWRVLLLTGIATKDAAAIQETVAALGLIADPRDPRLAITACVGKPACASASVPTRADAARLAQAGLDGLAIHVSGCAKGCAHPAPAQVTLVGSDGRYDLVRQGRASDAPVRRGLDIVQAIAALRLGEKEAS